MRQLIVGASGLIGSALHWCAQERDYMSVGTRLLEDSGSLETLNICDRTKVMRFVRQMEPDVIFLCAGLSNPDDCEKHPDKSYQVNVTGVKNVLEAANRVNALLVFFSSAYIFDGTQGPYSEIDTPNPQSVYGWHKLLGEHLIATSDGSHLIIRTSNVFGWDRLNKNSVLQVTNLLKHGRRIKLAEDRSETPIYSRCLANAAMDLVELKKHGVFHVSGSETVSPFRFGMKIADIFGLDESLIKPTKAKLLKTKAPMPVNACLTNKKASKVISTSLTGTQVGLKQMLKDEL